MNYWEKLSKSKHPKSKSYSKLKSAVLHDFTVAKLQCFSYVASKVEPYLKMCQTNNPVMPYMYFDLKTMLKNLLEIIVEPEVIQKCKTSKQLIKIDPEKKKKENLNKVDKIDLEIGVDTTLKKLCTADLVSKAKVTEFKKECQQLVIAMVSKLTDKSPLGSNFLLSLFVLNPQFWSSRPRSTVLDR